MAGKNKCVAALRIALLCTRLLVVQMPLWLSLIWGRFLEHFFQAPYELPWAMNAMQHTGPYPAKLSIF